MKKVYLMLIVIIGCMSCSKKDDTSTPNNTTNNTPNNNPPSITINSAGQVWMKIDGNVYSKIADGINVESAYGSARLPQTPPATSTATYDSFLDDVNTTDAFFSITKGTLSYMGFYPDSTTFKNFFSTGSYSYSASALNGIVISYWDSNHQLWSTDQGTGSQTGSSFVITDMKTNNTFDYTAIIRVTFNCKVYNSTGQSKTLTEGVYVGGFANI